MGVVKLVLLSLLMCLFFVGGFALDSFLNERWGISPLKFDQAPASTRVVERQ